MIFRTAGHLAAGWASPPFLVWPKVQRSLELLCDQTMAAIIGACFDVLMNAEVWQVNKTGPLPEEDDETTRKEENRRCNRPKTKFPSWVGKVRSNAVLHGNEDGSQGCSDRSDQPGRSLVLQFCKEC